MRHAIHTIIALGLASALACDGTEKKNEGSKSEVEKPGTAAPQDASVHADAASADADEDEDEAALLAALDPKVRRATEIASSIERDPESSDDVLARSDLDREGLDALMYEIAINPELASQYRIARGLK